MKKATLDPAVNLDLYFRKGRNGSKVLNFFNKDGTDFELEDEFEFRSEFTAALSKATNKLTLEVTDDDVEDVRRSYFYEIVNITKGKTWFCGTSHFTETTAAEFIEATDVQIVLDGEIINITINEAGGDFSGDVNGGTP